MNNEIKDQLQLGTIEYNKKTTFNSIMVKEGFSMNEFMLQIEIKDNEIVNLNKKILYLEKDLTENKNYTNSLNEKVHESNNNLEEYKNKNSTILLNKQTFDLKRKLEQKEKELKNLKNSIKQLKEDLLIDAEKAEK